MPTLTDLPLEVLRMIIELSTPLTSEFDDELDDPHSNPFLVVERHAPRSDCTKYARVCRALWHAASPVIWEYLVVDSPARLQAISRMLRTGFHHLPFHPSPRRLDLRLPPHYDLSQVLDILQASAGLSILVVANAGSSDGSSLVRSAMFNAIRRGTPALRRLQFMNDRECISLRQLEDLGRSLPQLRTLQCFEVIPRRSPANNHDIALHFPNLRTLSLGKSAGSSEGIHRRVLQCLARPGCLPALVRFDILDYPSSFKKFLTVVGPNLTHLTLTTTNRPFPDLRNIFSTCHNLYSLTIVVGPWDYANRWPRSNDSLVRINLVQPLPPYVGAMEAISALRSMRNTSFHRLDTIYLHFDWDFYYDFSEEKLQRAIGTHPLEFGRIPWPHPV